MPFSAFLLAAAVASALAPAVTPAPTAKEMGVVSPQQQQALLASADPQLAANKRLAYDMYRIVLQAGDTSRAHEFIARDYIQHNPNAAQGLAGLVAYIKATRPVRPVLDHLAIPLIRIVAEGDYVTLAFARPEKDAQGQPYVTTWFDMFRIENGRIAEHWDPMLRSDKKIDPNTQKMR